MKKVAHFIDSEDPGGAESLVVQLCQRIEPFGYKPEVYHFGNSWLVEKCNEFGIQVLNAPGYLYYKSIKTLPLFAIKFARFLKNRNIDLIHSHLLGAISGASIAAFLSRIPHIGTIHDTYTITDQKLKIHLYHLAAILGTHLVTVSDSMHIYLKKLSKFKYNIFETIPNGVDLEKYAAVKRNKYLSRLGIHSKGIVFITVGRLEKIKGFDILIKAFQSINSRNPKTLLIAGDGPERENLQDLIQQYGMDNQIIILGFRNDVPELLKNSDCFVLASHSEGLSYSIIEAMAAALPLVATDVGGNRELVTDGENGFLVPSKNPDLFAEKIQIILENPDILKRFGSSSLAFVRQKYSIDSTIIKYVDLYDQMLS